MCIRDRCAVVGEPVGEILTFFGLGADRTRAIHAGCRFGWVSGSKGVWVDAVFNVISVSYTHLRAHETVLDLVCRLLLEKKNKYTPATILFYDNIM